LHTPVVAALVARALWVVAGLVTKWRRVTYRDDMHSEVPHQAPPLVHMEQFPWPPPLPTFRWALPRPLLFDSADDRLGDVFNRLREGLRRGGFDDWSVYAVGEDGFALAARMESIHDDGRPLPGDSRWLLRSPRRFSLAEVLKSMVVARPGRYRILVFTLTPRSTSPNQAAPPSPDAVQQLPRRGAGQLSPGLFLHPAPPKQEVEALIYEFVRSASDEPIALLEPNTSALSARAHLVGAGIRAAGELQ
jgi:hypothetical protein